jgi:Leucyl-tRNA synthetase
MKRMGWGLDWDRLMSAHEPEYYRWDQWLFLKLLGAGLAYRKGSPVKWCPVDQVVLANEQVHDGRCEYCGAEVVSKNLEQWFFKTTAYADELLTDLEHLGWPDRIKAMQRNWIGRSEGAEIQFRIPELDEDVAVFTTRPRHALRRDVLRSRPRSTHSSSSCSNAHPSPTCCATTSPRPPSSAARSARRRKRRPASSPGSTPRTR